MTWTPSYFVARSAGQIGYAEGSERSEGSPPAVGCDGARTDVSGVSPRLGKRDGYATASSPWGAFLPRKTCADDMASARTLVARPLSRPTTSIPLTVDAVRDTPPAHPKIRESARTIVLSQWGTFGLCASAHHRCPKIDRIRRSTCVQKGAAPGRQSARFRKELPACPSRNRPVIRAPFRPLLKPVCHVTRRTAHRLAPRLSFRFQAKSGR